jgi:16S rRNA processing protein RimM
MGVCDPMAYKSDILLGRIIKVSGFEGAVTVKLERLFSGKLPNMESVFLEIEGRPVPFFISDVDYSGADILRLKFVGYNSSGKVTEFVGCRLFLTNPETFNNKIEEINSLTGYNVVTSENITIGTITEVIQNPGQWLLSVISDSNKTILIPLHEHFIVRIDNAKKLLIMTIPEGLTEIN